MILVFSVVINIPINMSRAIAQVTFKIESNTTTILETYSNQIKLDLIFKFDFF